MRPDREQRPPGAWLRASASRSYIPVSGDRDLIFSDMTPEARKQQAGARTDAHRHAVSLHNLCKEMTVALWATGEIRKTEFIKDRRVGIEIHGLQALRRGHRLAVPRIPRRCL